jgi:hypothetical protein
MEELGMPKRSKGGVKKTRSQAAPVTPKPNGHSLIIRSAESLGRMIGALQRQLEELAAHASAGGAAKPAKKRPPRATARKGKPRNTAGKAAASAKGD